MADDLEQVVHDSARGSFYLGIGDLVSTVILAVGTFITARLLGETLYGVYTLSLTIPATLIELVNFGINEGVIKYSASFSAEARKDKVVEFVSVSLIFNTCVGMLFFFICFVFSDFLATYAMARPQYAGYLRLASFIILLQTTFNSAKAVFVGLSTMEYSALTSIISATVKTVITAILVIAGFGITGAIAGFITSLLAAALIGMLIVFIKVYRPLTRQSIHIQFSENTKMLLKYGLPLYGGTIIMTLNSQVQNLILPFFASDTEVGAYRAAANFIVLISAISIPISRAFLPAFSRLSAKPDHLKTLFRLAVKYICLILLPVVMLLVAFSSLAVSTIYGFGQSSASLYLILLSLQFLTVGLGSVLLGSLFSGIGKTRIVLHIQMVSLIVQITLTPILMMIYGVSGLIISTLIAASVSTAYGARIARKEANALPDYRAVGKIYLATFVSFALLEAFKFIFPLNNLLEATVASLCYLLLYLTLLPLLKILTLQELHDLERIARKTRSLAIVAKPFITYERILLTRTAKRALSFRTVTPS